MLSGEVGTGKTTLCRSLLQNLPENTRLAFVLNPKLNAVELLATICDELDIEYPQNSTSLKELTDCLTNYLLDSYEQRMNVVVMIDEAQNLATEVLEQIRLLTNLETNEKKLLQIILVGQPELQEKLARRELRQLAQRITARYHLQPLTLKETFAYLLHRVRIAGSRESLFDTKAVQYLHTHTGGVPRLINTVCERALLEAFNRGAKKVDLKSMKKAVAEVLGGGDALQKGQAGWQPRWRKWAYAIPVIALLIIAYWLGQQQGIAKKQPVKAIPAVTAREFPAVPSAFLSALHSAADWDMYGQKVMRDLLGLWQLQWAIDSPQEACEYAAQYGLKCHADKGTWQRLLRYNRATALQLEIPNLGSTWVLLRQLKDGKAVVRFQSQNFAVDVLALNRLWNGNFRLLWQAPEGVVSRIAPGDSGPLVRWLSQQLNRLPEFDVEISEEYSTAMQQAVKRFQRLSGIRDDGIVGMETLLKLNERIYDGLPLLVERG